jgi:RimJ/RimL family protein N-acetyltransferase
MELRLSFSQIDYNSDLHCDFFCKWENDQKNRHLFSYFPTKEASETLFTEMDFKKKTNRPKNNRANEELLINLDSVPVGFMSFELDPPHKKNRENQTAWMAIVIGEERARGKGIGYSSMKELERLAKGSNALWAEVGVFEFNARAHALYKKLGYQEITRIENFTYWDNKMWSDIRLVKLI